MKFTKMSLVAALLIGSSAFAIDNVKVSGDAKLYYSTKDYDDNNAKTDDGSIFGQDNSTGQVAVGLGATADLTEYVSAGVHATILSTLGLENNLVGGVWAGNIAPNGNNNGNGLQASNGTAWWIDQAWLAASYGKTTGKIGRMELDTPLAFTEKWNIAENTFESVVLINQDIPDTTLVAAYVGGSNGSNGSTVANAQDGKTPFRGYTTYNDGAAAAGAALGTNALDAVGGAGAYAAGIVNNSFKPLTVQAWYYNVCEVADAYWLQADLNMNGILVGAQYTDMKLKNNVTSVSASGAVDVKSVVDANSDLDMSTSAYGLMLGYAMKDVVTVKAAYTSVDDKGVLTIQNTATGDQSKLYTEAWWNYGIVGQAGADSYMLSAEGNIVAVDILAQYTHADVDHKGADAAAKFDEFTVTASKSFGPLDTTLAYIYTKMDNKDGGNYITGNADSGKLTSNTIQAYLTLNF
jgi:hypothetical protein